MDLNCVYVFFKNVVVYFRNVKWLIEKRDWRNKCNLDFVFIFIINLR